MHKEKGLLLILIIISFTLTGCFLDDLFHPGSNTENNRETGQDQDYGETGQEAGDQNYRETGLDEAPDFNIVLPAEENLAVDEDTNIIYINNTLFLYANDQADPAEIDDAIESIGGRVIGGDETIGQVQIQVESSSKEELEEMIRILEENPAVDAVFIDELVELDLDGNFPNDPWTDKNGTPVYSFNSDAPAGNEWWYEAVRAPECFSLQEGLPEILVGVIDSGFQPNHEDLAGIFVSTVGNRLESGHGTHVSGIIAAKNDNQIGISGICRNAKLKGYDATPSAEWFNQQGGERALTTKSIILYYLSRAINDGCKVINLSMGSVVTEEAFSYPQQLMEHYNRYGRETSRVIAAHIKNGKDFLLVESAGNGIRRKVGENQYAFSRAVNAFFNGYGCSITPQNCYRDESVSVADIMDRVLIVGASQLEYSDGVHYRQTVFSNGGDLVEIFAPGYDVLSCGIHPDAPNFNGYYMFSSGTSMSTPIVTGVAATIWSANPQLTGPQVHNIILDPENAGSVVEFYGQENRPTGRKYYHVDMYKCLKKVIPIAEHDLQDKDIRRFFDYSFFLDYNHDPLPPEDERINGKECFYYKEMGNYEILLAGSVSGDENLAPLGYYDVRAYLRADGKIVDYIDIPFVSKPGMIWIPYQNEENRSAVKCLLLIDNLYFRDDHRPILYSFDTGSFREHTEILDPCSIVTYYDEGVFYDAQLVATYFAYYEDEGEVEYPNIIGYNRDQDILEVREPIPISQGLEFRSMADQAELIQAAADGTFLMGQSDMDVVDLVGYPDDFGQTEKNQLYYFYDPMSSKKNLPGYLEFRFDRKGELPETENILSEISIFAQARSLDYAGRLTGKYFALDDDDIVSIRNFVGSKETDSGMIQACVDVEISYQWEDGRVVYLIIHDILFDKCRTVTLSNKGYGE